MFLPDRFQVLETHQVSVHRNHVTNRKRVNQYEVVDEINHGVHGKVKLAYNTLTNGEVALKVIRRAARTTRAPDAIRREIAVLKRVHHANIISCPEVIDDPDHPKVYLVLEHAEIGPLPWRRRGQDRVCRHEWERTQVGMKRRGIAETPALRESLDSQDVRFNTSASANQPPNSLDLATCESTISPASSVEGDKQSLSPCKSSHCLNTDINEKPFSDQFQYVPCITIEQARQAILDVVLGLECLHAHGIVHRDIKPDNLLWTRDYRVKICDFSTAFVGPPSHGSLLMGLSSAPDGDLTLFDGEDEMMRTIGTPGYIAPELCCIRPDSMDLETLQQVDIWSLGVTLYCLVFARLPFVADDEFRLYRKMAEQDVYIPKQRLRPVPPSFDVCAPMIFSAGQYRRDDAIEDEHLDKELLDLLHRMLTRDAHKRIRLADIKKHPWLSQASTEHHNLGTPKSKFDGECGIGFW